MRAVSAIPAADGTDGYILPTALLSHTIMLTHTQGRT